MFDLKYIKDYLFHINYVLSYGERYNEIISQRGSSYIRNKYNKGEDFRALNINFLCYCISIIDYFKICILSPKTIEYFSFQNNYMYNGFI
jgi:hypothetical protein